MGTLLTSHQGEESFTELTPHQNGRNSKTDQDRQRIAKTKTFFKFKKKLTYFGCDS